MVRILSETPVGGSLRHIQAACKSTDTKPTDGVITGSICLEVDTGNMYLYDESGTGEWSKVSSGVSIHICSSNEYDATTRVPTVTNPDASTFYFVPAEDGTSPNLFVEWIYVNNAWEMFGSASVDLSGLVSDVQINGTSVVTDGVANITPSDLAFVQTVSGTTPTITAKAGVRYICGEVSTLAVTAPASGIIDVVFESGSTPTVPTIDSAKTGVSAIKWANGWNEICEANTVYEINIMDGEFGAVGAWT